MKFQILVPQYKESDEVIKPLLDSIMIQQNVDMNEIGVVVCNDGSDIFLSDELLNSYPFKIEYYKCEHHGVSATRNACLDHATADYVMFCDIDDMFFNACGLYIIFREMENEGFDSFMSSFIEESRNPMNKSEVVYITHQTDSTFVHGKVHRRQFLIDNNIRWNNNLTIHEDSYFNCLCQKIADPNRVKFCPNAFYLWKWRDESVCRHDPKYILKTYNNMLDSNTALVTEFLKRNRDQDAQFYAAMMIYDAYFTMNKKEWIDQSNKKYRNDTERRFAQYYRQFRKLFEAVPEQDRFQLVSGIRNRMYQEGLLMESVTFDDWIKKVLKKY